MYSVHRQQATGKYMHFTIFIDYTDSRIMNMTLDSIVVDIITFFCLLFFVLFLFILCIFFFFLVFRTHSDNYGVQIYFRWYVLVVDLIHVMQFTQFAILNSLKWHTKNYVCVFFLLTSSSLNRWGAGFKLWN